MLKFFRKYNKWILGIGGSLLMIVFLIQPVMDIFIPSARSMVIGTYDGGELTRGDLIQASQELSALNTVGLGLDPDGDSDSNDPLRWTLILSDAQRLGISASLGEADALLTQMGLFDANLEMLASRVGATPAFIRQAVRHWLIAQQYKELLTAQSHLSGGNRAALILAGANSARQRNLFEAMYFNAMAYGTPRVSKPLLEHFLQDQGASVTGRVVMVPAEKLLDQVDEPNEQQVRALYEQYKDDLPGQGEPYGFGYRIPDRVRVEYLSIPMDQALEHVKVTEADALAHYREHPERFTAQGEAQNDQAEPLPYEQVRDRVIEDLKNQRAFELVEKMAKAAYGSLYEDTRGMAKADDYRVIEDLSALKPLRQLAEELEAEFGLRPVLHPDDGNWINVQNLSRLPGIGQSWLADNTNVDFTTYVRSARELKPDKDNPLLPRRLQVGLAGSPMISLDYSRHVFRLTAAEPTRQPASLDEVRDRVTEDAKRLAAYRKLLAEEQTWLDQAVESGLESVAQEAGTDVVPLPPTTRREPLPNGMLGVPVLPAVGQSEAFIEAYFATASKASEQGDVATLPAGAVTGVVGIDQQLALAVYRVDDFEPLTRQAFNEQASEPTLPLKIDVTVLSPARQQNPLSLEALTQRLNYTDGSSDQLGEPAEDQPLEKTAKAS